MYETGFLLIVGADTDVDMREAREDLVLRSLSTPHWLSSFTSFLALLIDCILSTFCTSYGSVRFDTTCTHISTLRSCIFTSLSRSCPAQPVSPSYQQFPLHLLSGSFSNLYIYVASSPCRLSFSIVLQNNKYITFTTSYRTEPFFGCARQSKGGRRSCASWCAHPYCLLRRECETRGKKERCKTIKQARQAPGMDCLIAPVATTSRSSILSYSLSSSCLHAHRCCSNSPHRTAPR